MEDRTSPAILALVTAPELEASKEGISVLLLLGGVAPVG